MSERNTPCETSKANYTPVEAAVRWAGLLQHEEEIRRKLDDRIVPAVDEFVQWPELRLKAALLDDAITHRELSCEIDGVQCGEAAIRSSDKISIRHVVLREWFTRYFPSERPAFLFTEFERQTNLPVTLSAINALVFEREGLKLQLGEYRRKLESHCIDRKENSVRTDRANASAGSEKQMCADLRNETTYLHIVGGLLRLLLGHSPSGKPYSSFATQAAIIDALVAQYGGRLGITERTLQARFAEAKRRLSST